MSAGAVELRPRAVAAIGLTSLAGLLAFLWPLVITPDSALAHSGDAPLVFAVILVGVLAIVLAEVSDGGMDTKAVAMLGVLSAVGAILRPVGAGTAGLEGIFFLLILGGRVFGPGFGFILGATTLAASALLTAGVGPWLPFQMLAAAWVAMGAGLLPRAKGALEIVMLCAYGVVTGLLYGAALNFSFWPFTVQGEASLSFVAGAPVTENLTRFLAFSLATSLGWDLGRSLTNAVLIALLGRPVLGALRRAARRASFRPRAPRHGSAAPGDLGG
ncbi:ECF transporter S component [Janibacter corallicola]|uniref:ECF transporter S component n=1 Tax=Janibacter corallicola TaxID=415212 RepID=UPI00082E508D|nr:ECF transporter S component [Janibacter corallicola]